MKNNLPLHMLISTLLLGSLAGCAGSATNSKLPPPTENADVIISAPPAPGAADTTIHSAFLKRDALAHKDIQQVLIGVCRDFATFSPDQNFTLSDADQELNSIPAYRYQAPTKKYPPLLADVQRGRYYPLDKDWCKQARRDKKKGL
jgi:hypothetical protein